MNKTDGTFEIWDSDPGDPIEFKWVDEEQRKLEIKNRNRFKDRG